MKTFIRQRKIQIGIACFAAVALIWLACAGREGPRHISAKQLEEHFDLRALTPLEIRDMEKILNSQVSPCGDDVTLAEALFNPKHCPLARLAGRFIMQQIMEGNSADEISNAYVNRYAALKGLEIPEDGAPRIGAEKPIVKIVIFTDFECPFCARAASYLHDLIKRYPDKVAVIHKNFPLASLHQNAEIAAKAGFAAQAQGKFWEMHDVMFSSTGIPLEKERLETMALGLSLDMDKFKEDMGSPAAVAAIEADVKLGKELGVDGTPAMFINGRKVENGIKGLEIRLEEELLRSAVAK